MQCLMSLHQTLQGNKRKAKSPARHREAYRSRLVRLGCEVMEDRVLLSAALPDYHFTAPALVAGTTQHNAPSSIGTFTKTPGTTTQSITMPLPTAPAVAHPTSPGTYQVVNGTLFGPNGPQYSDVKQSSYLGDCWLDASLAEAAYRDPALIRNMITPLGQYNENGTTVQLYDVRLCTAGGPAREILVDNEFAMYGGTEYNAQVLNGVLWVALAEKAYVEAAAAGYVVNSYTGSFAQVPDNYQDVNGGYPYWALNAITGNASTEYDSVNNGVINAEMAVNGGLVVLVTGSTPSSSLVVPDHSYAVLADNPGATWQFTLYNPWNVGSIYDWNGKDVYGSVFYCNQAFLDQNFDGFGFAVA